MNESQGYENTDVRLWRKFPEYDSPEIYVTKNGLIGINVGGFVAVRPIEAWQSLAARAEAAEGEAAELRLRVAALEAGLQGVVACAVFDAREKCVGRRRRTSAARASMWAAIDEAVLLLAPVTAAQEVEG